MLPCMLLDYGDGMLWKGKKFFDYTGIFRFINYFLCCILFYTTNMQCDRHTLCS